jgi:hypothetical protein
MRTRSAAKTFCIRVPDILVWLGWIVALTSDLSGQVLTRGPYLQTGSHTNITICWRTDVPTDGCVRYGTNLAALSFTNDDAAADSNHVVVLTQLSPDTKYFYAIGSMATLLTGGDTNHFFITSPVPGTAKPTRVWVIGDAGTALPEQIAVRDAFELFTGLRHTDLWLMLGDNAYYSGLDAEYQTAVFDVYTNLLRKSAWWTALGNHDTAQATEFVDTYPYFDIVTLPKNGEAGGVPSGTEHYYSFDYGNIHFICLDSITGGRTTTSPMYAWLTNDLAHNQALWTIAYWHHPPYTKGSHDSDFEPELMEMREVFVPVLEQHGVDLVLAGHSHSYERSHLLDHHYGDSSTLTADMKLDIGGGGDAAGRPYHKHLLNPRAHQGAVYAVVGSSGWTSGGALNHPAMHVSLNQLGSLVLDINSNRLDATFLRETGVTNDTFTIVKVNSTTSLRILSATLNSSGYCTLTWAAVGGLRYRVSYRDGDLNGTFTDLVQQPVAEINLAPEGMAATQSFTDNFTLTGGAPVSGTRYFRVRVVPWN